MQWEWRFCDYDEAQTLVTHRKATESNDRTSSFDLIRCALSTSPCELTDQLHLFATMLNTRGQLSKRQPENARDRAARLVALMKLYELIWSFPFNRCYDEWDTDFKNTFIEFGRFLWKSMKESGMP